ncbi:MAG TPA: enoyl-CoA hydratase-related protein [Acidimicrobiia bacterium]
MSIDVERADKIVTVTLNRPDKLNALDLEHILAFRDSLRGLDDDPSVRAVVLTGAGRGFCAGGDVTSMTGEGGGSSEPLDLRAVMEVSELLHGMSAFTVAAVNGPCAGAGLSFACACDLRYAARSAVFVSAFLRVGSSGDHGSTWVLTRAVGPAKARELLFLGDRVDADEALRIGLVSAVLDDDALRDHVDAVAARLAAMPPNAARLMKQNLDDALTLPLGAYLDAETARFAEGSGSPESIAAAKAFLAGS